MEPEGREGQSSCRRCHGLYLTQQLVVDFQSFARCHAGSLGTQQDITTSLTPRFGPCDVSDLRHRMKRAVAALGRAEVEEIIREEGKIEVSAGHSISV